MHALWKRVDRTLAWEEKCKRLLLRFARMPQRHSGMQLMVYTWNWLRVFGNAKAARMSPWGEKARDRRIF